MRELSLLLALLLTLLLALPFIWVVGDVSLATGAVSSKAETRERKRTQKLDGQPQHGLVKAIGNFPSPVSVLRVARTLQDMHVLVQHVCN